GPMVWGMGLILTRVIDSGQYLVMFSQPRFFAPAFNSYRTPDFDVCEIIQDPQSRQIFCRPHLIVEVKAPSFPHSLGPGERDKNTDILMATSELNKWGIYLPAGQGLLL
ncbi:hypothetical protein BS47DRAFT_1345911, partial [Hydnum rufescens UP504]